MSVFGGQSQTEIATGLQNPDYSLTTNWGPNTTPPDNNITKDWWLPGTTGVDCKLVHGDRWQEIAGNMTQHVAQSKTSNYDGDFTETYGGTGGTGTVTRTMNGHVTENYFGGTNGRDYHGHLDEHYHAGHTQLNDVEEIESRKWKAEAIQGYSWETNPFKFELLGGGVTVAGGELKFLGAEASIAGAHIEAGAIAASFHAYDRGEAALEQKIHAVDNQFKGLGFAILDVANLAIRPVDVHTGGPSVGTAPFTPAVP